MVAASTNRRGMDADTVDRFLYGDSFNIEAVGFEGFFLCMDITFSCFSLQGQTKGIVRCLHLPLLSAFR